MNYLFAISDALAVIDQFLIRHARELEPSAVDRLIEASGKVSPVDKIVQVGDLLYAIRGSLNENALTLAAQLIEFATRNGWHSLNQDGRGQRMVDAIRRQLGEPHPTGGEWPAPETDPEPQGCIPVATPFEPLERAKDAIADLKAGLNQISSTLGSM